MVVFHRIPKIQITNNRSGTTYNLEGYHTTTDVILVENGVSQAIITASDKQGETFLNKVDINDNLQVKLKYADGDNTWYQVFGGYVFDLTPMYSAEGELLTVQARGYGLGLLAMPVGEEYGTQSRNPTLNTIQEILTDASKGIIPKWVHKVLNSATDSGYSFNTTKIPNTTSDFRYLYWPYNSAKKAIDDMIDLIAAANLPSVPGAHWIVIPDGTTAYLCTATVGIHPDPPADIWPTWWNTDQAGSTIEVKKDMIVSKFTKQRSDGNYILYSGKLQKPGDADYWTENHSGDWSVDGGVDASYGKTDDNAVYKVGSYSLKCYTGVGLGSWVAIDYPSTKNAAWNIDAWGGKYNIPQLVLFLRRDAEGFAQVDMRFCTDVNNYYYYRYVNAFGTALKWYQLGIPIGPYTREKKENDLIEIFTVGAPSWSNINWFTMYFANSAAAQANFWVDNLYFLGHVLRGARDDTKIASQKCHVKVIVDDVGKDDTGKSGTPGTTDIGMMAQLAKAELLRAVTTPIIGSIVIPGKETILPGQLAHIHFGKKNGSYNIDSNMRILQVNHRFAPEPHGFRTYLMLTDDVKNSRPMQPSTAYNLLLKATNPSYQTRERASIKARDIDITQPILSENYST